MGAIDHTSSDVKGGAVPAIDFEGVDASRRGDDVDNSVDCTHFVEVNFFNGNVVDSCFAGTEEFEGSNGGLFDCGGEVCCVDQVADDREGAAVQVLVRIGVFGLVGVGMFVCVIMRVGGFVGVSCLG